MGDRRDSTGKPEMKAGRRKSVDVGNDSGGEEGEFAWDWENESTPLKSIGKKVKFIKPCDKHSCNEGDNCFIAFQVEGSPPPQVQFFKGFKDLAVEPRYKIWTDGSTNHVILGINQARQEEEGDYKCVLKGDDGAEIEFDFKVFVTVEGGMDFRAMLMKRKVKQKKIVVKKIEWLETPVDQEVQQGKCDKVILTCKLSEKDKKGKWYLRNPTTFQDIRSGEHGLELHKDPNKYEWSHKDDTYTFILHNPVAQDTGRYGIVVKINDKNEIMTTGGYIDVKAADPEYYFTKLLKDKDTGFTNRSLKIKCEMNTEGAKYKWMKDGKPISWADGRIIRQDKGHKLCLHIPKCTIEDTGMYSVEIQEFVKNGERDQTDCYVTIEEYPHKFTSKLKGKSVVEHDEAVFEIDVEAEDADVKWYIDGKKVNPDDKRFQVVVEGKKRKLIIKDTLLSDAGEITCKTNKDSSACNLRVAHLNKFIAPLQAKATAVEREALTFNVQVKDPEAPVEFYIGGQKVFEGADTSGIEVKHLGDGKHQLVLQHIKMSHMGAIEARTPTNRGDDVATCQCNFDVIKGEEAPQIGDCGDVTGIANKDCNWSVPYQIEGQQQSKMEVIVMKDGKELKIGQDVNVNIHGDRVDLAVINPKREKSGVYKVIMRNAQGQDERDINVNIMDKPTPPQTCVVNEVFYDNCVVNWTPPLDDGGTEIKGYIVEALDVSSGSDQWLQCARTEVGGDRKIKVNNLTHRHKYRFRVRAVNKLGQSGPCEMLGDDILIKDPWDEPTQPGRPNVVDWGPNHCDLSWKPPESDGGAPITHYEIEYMEKNLGLWEHGKTLSVREVREMGGLIHGTCDGLTEGCEYKFRIKAVNKGGPSIPSEPSDSMIAKIRFMKPFLHQPGMYDIEIKRGRTFRYDLWFGGEPPPTVTWERNGMVINADERTSIDLFSKKTVYCERNTLLTVTKAVRAVDTGHYTIKLTCDGGTFSATGYVNVLDVPDKPRCFQPDEVRAEHVKLSWAPPEDDGGTPITNYQVRMQDLDVGEWITVAECNSTSATIKGLKPGHLYQFEVYAVNKEGYSLPTRTKDPIKAENPYKPPSEPKEPSISDFDNQSVTLRWYKPADDGGRPITHYIIQKKDRFGGWFDALVTDDDNTYATIDELEARIPGLSEGKWYQFRIVAVNKAGESWPSIETKPHLCRHKNLAPCIDKGNAGSKSVKVNRTATWQIRVKGEPPPTFSWYKDGQKLTNGDVYRIETEEYQGGATATLQLIKAEMNDAGTYTLKAENRNGTDKVDLDLIVLDLMQDCECDMFKFGDFKCTCSSGFRQSELTAQQVLIVDFGEAPPLNTMT